MAGRKIVKTKGLIRKHKKQTLRKNQWIKGSVFFYYYFITIEQRKLSWQKYILVLAFYGHFERSNIRPVID